MTDPKETTSDTTEEVHGAGQPGPESATEQGSDVGGVAAGMQSTLENGLADHDPAIDGNPEDQARNPI